MTHTRDPIPSLYAKQYRVLFFFCCFCFFQYYYSLLPTPYPRGTVFLRMEKLLTALPYVELVLAIFLILGVVLQQRGASLGGAFGGDNFSSTFYKRRGAEKFLFTFTIVISILFVVVALANFILVA